MFNFRNDIIFRFHLLVLFVFVAWGVLIAGKAAFLMLQKNFWEEVASFQVKTNIPLPATRGNILSDNGELLVCNHVKYNLFIDFDYTDKNKKMQEKVLAKKDTVWRNNLKALCKELSRVVPRWSAKEYESHLNKGMELQRKRLPKRREYSLFPQVIDLSYTQYKQIKELPILSRPVAYSGLKVEEKKERKKLFGSLAVSTLGNAKESETTTSSNKVWTTYGLEKKYDYILSGKPGWGHRLKSRVTIDLAPVHGKDIQTTINTDIQDICEQALNKKIKEHGGLAGWCILMETKTGDIKAIVNLTRMGEDNYVETFEQSEYNITENHALSRRMEPGSIFKTVALAAALEDGRLKANDSVETYGGKHVFFKKFREDLVKPLEGQKYYNIDDVLMHSSNVGMIQMVAEKYASDNSHGEFVKTLKRFGMDENYKLIESEVTPSITDIDKVHAKSVTLMTMSYGYSIAMTAINMLTFYNTIANNGDQMAPRLVKAVMKDGEVVEEFPTRVLRSDMLSDYTVETLKKALIAVVNGDSRKRTGKSAQSDKLLIAGKTGTANVSGVGGYQKSGKLNLYSFCGFFPANKPEYTCIVQVLSNKSGGGGSVSAPVLKEIAEKVSAKELRLSFKEAKDTIHATMPTIKKGNITSANYLFDEIDINVEDDNVSNSPDEPTWGSLENNEENGLIFKHSEIKEDVVPNVIGMGAKDALYLMKKVGLKVSINGHGRVVSQSLSAGQHARKGDYVLLTLKP
ncbi:MAG: transpeptidase family protein [Bacteroidaceae bacterium]|nr:transpeptidase family protein [Bacteroidaceae bacterium]